LVTAGKHVNNIGAIARQPPISTYGLQEVVFSVESAPRLYSEDPRPDEVEGVKIGHPVPGGYKYENMALQVGEVSNLRV
jgi:hypothetical protein